MKMQIVPAAEGHLDPERIRKMNAWFRVNHVGLQKAIIKQAQWQAIKAFPGAYVEKVK